jgi:NAD(P)-dependent dehydrogenase (short-subunit alcohol dehydrogenase family)
MAAIITGADSGIGKATAVALARRGHDVGITYSRDEDGAKATAEEVRAHGRRAEVRHLDLSETADVQATIDNLADALGRLDILVNNAGSGASTPFLEIDLAEWRDVLEVDLTRRVLNLAGRRPADGRKPHARTHRERHIRPRARAAEGLDPVCRVQAWPRRPDQEHGA